MSFQCLAWEILNNIDYAYIKNQVAAILALQEATKMYMNLLFEDSNLCTIHAHWAMTKAKDIQLTRHRVDHHDD